MPVPTAETPPFELDADWLGVWRHCLKVMKAQGSWRWEQKPLLDEYVFALIRAADCRSQPRGGLEWDRCARRALILAETLGLTPASQRKLGVPEQEGKVDPLGGIDELARRRAG